MPEISRFMGMVIKMLFLDNDQHHKPHVHVIYGDFKASVGIDGEMLAGSMKTNCMLRGTKLFAAYILTRSNLCDRRGALCILSMELFMPEK